MQKLLLIFIILSTLFNFNFALIDNGILGDPYVNCGENSIDVQFDTRNTFRGIVFVQNHLNDSDCRSAPVDKSANNIGARNTQIRLNFKSCGLQRKQNTNPNGLFLSTTLVVAFHSEFLTKFDRIYIVKCFYMETQSECGKEIIVKMPPPLLQTQQVPMPVCRYEVLEGGPEGPPVFYATVGQMVYHKWTCDSEQKNQFCMIVHSCTVDDGNGDRVDLIDENGCAHDKYLLQNLDYVSDLMVGKEAHVYKYADRPSIFFDCKITVTIKEPGIEYCNAPSCSDPPRRRRSHFINETNEKNNKSVDGQILNENMSKNYIISNDLINKSNQKIEQQICLTHLELRAIATYNIIAFIISTFLLFNAYKLM